MLFRSGGEPVELSVHAWVRQVAARCASGHAEGEDLLGWQSLYYGNKEPAPTVEVLLRQAELPVRLVTVLRLGAGAPRVEVPADLGSINCEGTGASVTISMVPPGEGRVVVAAVLPRA